MVEGTFDWMGMAHALGVEGAEPELVGIGPRTPLLGDDQVLFLGYGPERARPFELDQIVRRGLAAIPVDAVAADPEAAAGRALEFASRFDRLLVHFDVDVIDFNDAQLSEDAVRGDGLTLDAAMRALRVLASSERLSARDRHRGEPVPRRRGRRDAETVRGHARRLPRMTTAKPGAPERLSLRPARRPRLRRGRVRGRHLLRRGRRAR